MGSSDFKKGKLKFRWFLTRNVALRFRILIIAHKSDFNIGVNLLFHSCSLCSASMHFLKVM